MADAQAGEPNTGLLLFLPYRVMEARVFESLLEAGFSDITLAQSRIFQRIGVRGTRLTDLAEQARVTKQTAAVLVQSLEDAGYVYRAADPTDARSRLVCIAPRGDEAVTIASRAVADVETEWQAVLGKRNYSQLRKLLLQLREVTDPYG